jgi:hypothetical protein
MIRLRPLAVLALAVAILGLEPTRANPPRPVIIPFLYEDARLYVPVRIGGRLARWFILDTGATPTIVDTAVAREAGLTIFGSEIVRGAGSGSSQQSQSSAIRLSVGGVPLRIAKPAIMDLAQLLGPTSGRAPAGIIGSQFFREHFVDIDFVKRRMIIFPSGIDRRPAYAASVPLTFADWTPLTQVRLTLPAGRVITGNALVDLGAKSTFLIPEPFIDRERLREAFPKAVVTGFGAGVGGDTYYAFARARRLGLAHHDGLALDRPVIGLSVRGTLRSTWHEGLLGAEFLSRFRLGFDYTHRRLLLTQQSRQAAPFDRSGLFLVASGDELRQIQVRSVLAGGPGALAGLSPSDEILAIDGTPSERLGLPAIRERLKLQGSVLVVYRHGTEHHSTQIQLRDLL